MNSISVFDMLKIGVGPSSSHTLGPWRASERWIKELKEANIFDKVQSIKVDLYGSLSLTGKGHATDIAVILGLFGADPEYFDTTKIESTIHEINETKTLNFNGELQINFTPEKDITFHKSFLPFHSNGLTYTAILENKEEIKSTFYSIGGGFICKETDSDSDIEETKKLPFPINSSKDLLEHCEKKNKKVFEIVLENEKTWRYENEINHQLDRVWNTMLECAYLGCHTEGHLPGGLNVRRRAFDLHKSLIKENEYSLHTWVETVRKLDVKFHKIFKWISCFALSVNEVNASLGRVVTAPTNGSAGVIPAVLMYYQCFVNKFATRNEIRRFLLVAGEIGCIFKKNATISAAMGGCQAEIGVSSAMAAGALTELLGGTPEQVTIAAEIAMEHHLGLTCDPIGGLVQIPCIERNSMGAIKAIHATELALESNANHAKVTLDEVIQTMWETAQDMNIKYKETSTGGLAVSVNTVDC
ncbi:L-serine ammonia-lyase [Aureivirga marina]|uniref:L-serine ammonia-lyase n=1 Tax=Aureivirga marina TaxID=1182451 RepID=UPI0018CA11ED|nr:L-serine ammonia-lyase [Aureivirga marina]